MMKLRIGAMLTMGLLTVALAVVLMGVFHVGTASATENDSRGGVVASTPQSMPAGESEAEALWEGAGMCGWVGAWLRWWSEERSPFAGLPPLSRGERGGGGDFCVAPEFSVEHTIASDDN